MAEWQVGDLALCVKVGPWVRIASGLVVESDPVRGGMVLTVRGVGINPFDGATALWFVGVGGDWPGDAYCASRFIKVTPPEADEFDRETIALLTGAGQEVGL